MKKQIFKHLAFGFAAVMVFALTSCSKGVDMGKYIPKDAMVVFNLDMDELWDKADLSNIDNISFVKLGRQELRSENPKMADIVDAIIKDPTSTGLHLKRDITIWCGVSNNDFDGTLLATMHNKKKFEEFLNKFAKENEMSIKFDDRDGWRVATLVNEFEIEENVMFNGEVAVLAFNANDVEKIANLKKDESLASDKRFVEYWKDRSEMSMWMSMGSLMDMAEQSGQDIKGMMGQIYGEEYWDAIEKASIAGNVIFDKGVMRMVFSYQGMDSKVFDDKYLQKFNGNLVDFMPENTYAVLAAAYNLDETMKALEADKDLGINFDEEVVDGPRHRIGFWRQYTLQSLRHRG